MRWLRFLISHSVFISLCAVALCYQTGILLNLKVNKWVYLLVFSCTLGGYNLYWIISKFAFAKNTPVEFLRKNSSNVFFLLIAAAGAAFALYNQPAVWLHFLVGTLLTLIYSLPLWPLNISRKLQRFGFLKTTLLAFTWTYITIWFPLAGHAFSSEAVWWLFLARFSFMLMLCAIFDARDASVDEVRAFHSLATDLSKQRLQQLMLVAFALFLFAGFRLRLFLDNHWHIAAFAITGLATLLVYRLSLKKRGYYFYYFFVDGLMMFSSLLTIVAHFG